MEKQGLKENYKRCKRVHRLLILHLKFCAGLKLMGLLFVSLMTSGFHSCLESGLSSLVSQQRILWKKIFSGRKGCATRNQWVEQQVARGDAP